MARGCAPWPLPRWAWWVIAIAVWIALAEGSPILWESGGREAWQGRNPRTGEAIAIAASKAPSFKAGKALRDAVCA